MPKFRVTGAVMAGRYCGEIEAANVEEAKEKAEELYLGETIGLCHHCSSEVEDPTIERVDVEEIGE